MATHPIFDTSSVIKYRSQLKPYFKVAYFPSLVFFELVSTSINQDELKLYSSRRNEFKKIRQNFIAYRKRHLGNRQSHPPLVYQQNRSANKTPDIAN